MLGLLRVWKPLLQPTEITNVTPLHEYGYPRLQICDVNCCSCGVCARWDFAGVESGAIGRGSFRRDTRAFGILKLRQDLQ
jgi:hypothetical protein